MPPVPKDPKDEKDDEFKQRKREELTKFYDGWIRHLDENSGEGSITPSVGGPRITKWAGSDGVSAFYVDPQGRPWDDGQPPADLTPMTREEAVEAAVMADLAANEPVETVEDVQNAFNFRSLDFYELVENEWYSQMQGELRIGRNYADESVDLDLRRFVSTLADKARENYLLVYTGGGQLDGKGDEIAEGEMTFEEYARRVCTAIRVLFYGGE